jgi:hypothetical protein
MTGRKSTPGIANNPWQSCPHAFAGRNDDLIFNLGQIVLVQFKDEGRLELVISARINFASGCNQRQESKAEFSHFTNAWYRANFDPFVIEARGIPFFFAWAPTRNAPMTATSFCC